MLLNTLQIADTVPSQVVGWLVNDELERMWKEAVVA
jgi:hypothetical protein